MCYGTLFVTSETNCLTEAKCRPRGAVFATFKRCFMTNYTTNNPIKLLCVYFCRFLSAGPVVLPPSGSPLRFFPSRLFLMWISSYSLFHFAIFLFPISIRCLFFILFRCLFILYFVLPITPSFAPSTTHTDFQHSLLTAKLNCSSLKMQSSEFKKKKKKKKILSARSSE